MDRHTAAYGSMAAWCSRLRGRWGLLIMLLLAAGGCTGPQEMAGGGTTAPAEDMDYTLVYLLHADADYLYHDREGSPLQADEKMLKEARAVARKASRGEVFIFHQRPEKNILGLFPKKDRRMYHYRGGTLVARKSYSPRGETPFRAEAALYRSHRREGDSGERSKRILLYYGHEIPARPRRGYYQSRPSVLFGSDSFSEGIARFQGPGTDLFDLVVLSTCNNGTPGMISNLEGRAHHVLASPQNLHLSHIDTDPLTALEDNPALPPAELADRMADHTFERMEPWMQTAVTIARYDMQEVGGYVGDLARRVEHPFRQGGPKTQGVDNIDCARLLPGEAVRSEGVRVWFKPPAFGRQSDRKNHSGWGCRPPNR
ncbi:hypothetical protein SAMN06265218_10673 [Fodinibius sediminis]|uniref:Uncharacterized protein n=2 Tax=Fodinibius sediminis TaxID=1214077 RepID=A0A521CGY2_9BACT|nr:hypothetical protein SAMN06265218_10673 [Fodinibius sediminis]